MESEVINPKFMKALIRCYLLQKQARIRVFHNRRFIKQLIQVFKWQRDIKRQVEAANKIPSDDSRQHDLLSNPVPPKSPASSAEESGYFPKLVKLENGIVSLGENPNTEATILSVETSAELNSSERSPPLQFRRLSTHTPPISPRCSSPQSPTSLRPPVESTQSFRLSEIDHDTDQTSNRVAAKRESVTDLDIVRRNLWLLIVRKDVIQAYRRKVSFKEQKQLKSRSIAYRCQTHFKEFHRHNNKHNQD